MSRRAPWLVALAAMLLALPYAWSQQAYPDEFTYASHGLRTLAGQWIYRDFFEFTPPVTSWLAAAWQGLMGPSLVALRVFTAAWLGLAAGLAYATARRLGAGPRLAALPGLATAGALYPLFPAYSHHWVVQPALALALWAAATERWLVAGLGLGLAGMVLQSDGLGLALGLGGWLVLDLALGEGGPRRAAARALRLAAGACLPVAAVALALAAGHALGPAVAQVVAWPLAHYRTPGGINDVRYMTDLQGVAATTRPGFKLGFYYVSLWLHLALWLLVPLLATLVGARVAGAVARRVRDGEGWSAATAGLALAACVMTGAFAVAWRGRCDFAHVLWTLPPALLVATLLAGRWRARFAGPGLEAVAALPAMGLAALPLLGPLAFADALHAVPTMAFERAGPDAYREQPAVVYVRAHARVGDRVAALPHGGVFYLFGLPPAARATLMYPPNEGYTTAAEYAAYWREVAAARPRFVVTMAMTNDGQPLPMPLAGYHLAAVLPYDPHARAWIYERDERS